MKLSHLAILGGLAGLAWYALRQKRRADDADVFADAARDCAIEQDDRIAELEWLLNEHKAELMAVCLDNANLRFLHNLTDGQKVVIIGHLPTEDPGLAAQEDL